MKPSYEELEAKCNSLTAKLSVINALMEAAEQANKLAQEATEKLVQERDQLAAENAGLKSKAAELVHEASEVYSAYNSTITEPDGDFMDMQTLQEMQCVETPVTDAFLAEVRASARKDFIDRIEWIIRNECNPEKTETILNELQSFSETVSQDAAQ